MVTRRKSCSGPAERATTRSDAPPVENAPVRRHQQHTGDPPPTARRTGATALLKLVHGKVRPADQRRHRLRRPDRRHPGVRRRLHREMVAHPGLQALSRGQRAADPGRRRRQQQLHGARLEIQPATPPLQPARLARDRGPLPAGHLEVESHRTPHVLRGHKELGGPPAGQLRDHPEIPAHHTHRHRTARACTPGAKDLQDRCQDHRRPDAGAAHHTRQLNAQMELHHRTHVTKNGRYFCADPK